MRDLLAHGATIVDVITRSTYRGWFAVEGGRFVEVEEGEAPSPEALPAARRIDLAGAVVQPGMIDAHMHIESSLVTPRRFAEAVLPWGTTTIVQDPHEIANVLGVDGIRWMVRASQGLPLRVLSAISSCIPATTADIETPNASIRPDDVTALASEPGVVALGEMMDFQGVIDGDPHLLAMLAAGAAAGLSLEGHVPTLTGPELSRYVAHGIRSNHTLMTPTKLREQLRKGLWIMVQEKSLTPDVVDAVMALPDRSRVMLITDDVMPNRLTGGHLSRLVERAIEEGWEPLDAIAAASLRPATYLGRHDLGVIAPGAAADWLECAGVGVYPPRRVVVTGAEVAAGGAVVPFDAVAPSGAGTPDAAFLATPFETHDVPASLLVLPTGAGRGTVRARVVVVNQVNSFTTLEERDVRVEDGVPIDDDLALALVIPRAALRGDLPERFEVGLLSGLGLARGGWASSFAHDSHNVFVLGRTPDAMRAALHAVLTIGGGMAFAPDGATPPVSVPLPIAGLLSDDPIADVAEAFDRLESSLRDAGVGVRNPVLLLTLLPLTVSPDWKVSDKGIVDVARRRVLPTLVAS
ncbi:MAG: adenine deaminase [Trueperaceae bacterium]|nr:adenine deaminase [Trueperaceae bacterium]